jgi:hypothetical protein
MAKIPTYEEWLSGQRRAYVLAVLRLAGGHQCRAADLMKVHRNTVKRMMLECDITHDDILNFKQEHRTTSNGVSANV